MVVNSLAFLWFFLVVMVVYYLCQPKKQVQNFFLLACSYWFYAQIDIKMTGLLVILTLAFWLMGRWIGKSIEQEGWIGVIDIQDCDFSQIIYDKPLVYYLLIHYLLLGITKIHVLTDEVNRKYLKGQIFTDLGFCFSFDKPEDANMMILNHPWFLFGSDLTQQFRGAMLSERNVKLVPENQEPVFFFSHGSAYFEDPKKFMKNAAKRTLGRGMVCLDMSDYDKSLDVANFVRIYQQNTGLMIGDLQEVVLNHKSVVEL